MSLVNKNTSLDFSMMTISLIFVIVITTLTYMLDLVPNTLQAHVMWLPSIIIGSVIILFVHLYIRQHLKTSQQLSEEIKNIKIEAEQQTYQLNVARLELTKKTALLDMLQQANLDFVEHSHLQRTTQFMINKLMDITESDCGFIGEVLRQKNGETRIRMLSICHRNNEANFSDTDAKLNPVQDEDLINEVLLTREVVIKNSHMDNPEQAGMPSCCAAISNTMLVPVFYGENIVGIYGLADCIAGYDKNLIEFLQPFSSTYAVLSHANRSYIEQAIIQEDLLNAKLEADKASYAKSEFLSRMSHELRTPLNVILGYSQLLLDEVQYKIEPDVANCLGKVEQSGQHLLKLINEVLDLSHVESGKLEMELKPVEVNPVIQEALNMVSVLTSQKNIRVTYKEEDFKNVTVQSDRLRLLQIMVNLLSNAIKYNRNNGEVLVYGGHENNNFVISIKDTGIGIPEEKKGKLFVAFDRLGAESSDIEGTGIGLPITKKLIEIMGGRIRLESEVNKGSTFSVYLENNMSKEVPDDTKDSSAAIYLDGIENGMHTILYIEDNKENAKLVEKILCKYQSLRLVTAEDGLTGLQLAASIDPDLILLDMHLPDLNGFDVLRKLKENEKTSSVPVLGVSANAMPQDVNDALSAGFSGYVTKPINIRIFLEAINDTLATLNAKG